MLCVCLLSTVLPAAAGEAITWDDCVSEGSQIHPDLIAAREAVEVARLRKAVAASPYFPRVDADLDRSRSRSEVEVGRYSYGVSASQLIFDGFATRAQVRSAGAELEASRSAYAGTSTQVRFRLRSAFLELLRVQELVTLTSDIAGRREKNAELVTLRYEAGREHRGSLLRAEAVTAQAQFDIRQSHRAVQVAQRELLKELGREKFVALVAVGQMDVELTGHEKPSLEELSAVHPETRQLESATKVREAGVTAARSSFLPRISARASYGRGDEHWPPREDSWTVGAGLSLPIFEGGSRKAGLSQARAALGRARALERSGKDAVTLALEQAWAARLDRLQWLVVQEKFLESALERAAIASAQYSSGLISFEDWNGIEDELVSARKALLNARRDAAVAEAGWHRAKGEGF